MDGIYAHYTLFLFRHLELLAQNEAFGRNSTRTTTIFNIRFTILLL